MLFLNQDEIEFLTGRKRPKAQAKILSGMGIRYKLNAVGALIVARAHVEAVLSDAAPTEKRREPNFQKLEAA